GRAGRGVLSLRQVSLHKQRKVARAVTARKLLILMSAKERRVRTRPTRLWRNGRRVKTRPTRLRVQLEQEPLAALAPSSGASRHLLPQAGEGLFGCSPASGRRAVWLSSRRREKGCLTELPQAGEGLLHPCGSGFGQQWPCPGGANPKSRLAAAAAPTRALAATRTSPASTPRPDARRCPSR